MLVLMHIWGAYAFVFLFLFSSVLSAYSLAKKREALARLSAWSYLASFAVLLVPYFGAFVLKAAIVSQGPAAALPHLEKHHNMSKFVLTGIILMAVGSGIVLRRYRDKALPAWFLPNMLFLAVMVMTFIVRSLVNAAKLGAYL